jgi:hypothetical protein
MRELCSGVPTSCRARLSGELGHRDREPDIPITFVVAVVEMSR